jgi:8-oxo-dGTP pyrophosphatase MutT (NUDIX family)
MTEDSQDLPFVERQAVRIVVLDANGRVLLLNTRDLGNPNFGTAWELPGGGVEEGESHVETAIRELREETGIAVTPEAISAPTWRRDVSYTYRGEHRLQHEIIVAVRIPQSAPLIEPFQATAFEREDHFEFRWWTLDEIAISTERFYPARLSTLLPQFLAGEKIDEPFESWP